MARHTLKILQQMLQDFKSVSDHFGTLCIKGLIDFSADIYFFKANNRNTRKRCEMFNNEI